MDMRSRKQKKKMIAPVVITAVFLLYYGGFAVLCLTLPDIPLGGKLAMGLVPLALGVVMICVLKQRIKEIRSGEEDDLGQY